MKEEKQYSIKEYISEIDESKNVNFIATIIKIQKVEINKAIIVGLNLKDNSGTILGIFVGKKNNSEAIKIINNFKINKKYKINGNIIIIDQQAINELESDKLIFKKLNVKDGDKTLAIRKIEEIK